MKLSGNLSDLTADDGENKRRKMPAVRTAPGGQSKGRTKSLKDPSVKYVWTRLELPESLKTRLDVCFASDPALRAS